MWNAAQAKSESTREKSKRIRDHCDKNGCGDFSFFKKNQKRRWKGNGIDTGSAWEKELLFPLVLLKPRSVRCIWVRSGKPSRRDEGWGKASCSGLLMRWQVKSCISCRFLPLHWWEQQSPLWVHSGALWAVIADVWWSGGQPDDGPPDSPDSFCCPSRRLKGTPAVWLKMKVQAVGQLRWGFMKSGASLPS